MNKKADWAGRQDDCSDVDGTFCIDAESKYLEVKHSGALVGGHRKGSDEIGYKTRGAVKNA